MGRRKSKIDMLSGLPDEDEVLCHILSFLTTWVSVRTSVLAKRWRYLWAHVPNLEFYGCHSSDSSKKQDLDIINRVIMLHEAKILNTFSLDLSIAKGCVYQLETLIIYPIKRSVQNLYLDFESDEYDNDIVCTLPILLFTCKTLVDLKLVNCGIIPSSGEMFLPSLKKLNLTYVHYEDDKSLPHLLSGCPVLEKLIVNDCFREGHKNLGCVIVSSPTIKTLNVDFTQGRGEYTDEMLIIDVPALVYLKVNHCDLDCVRSLRKTMTSLIEAKINLNGDWHTCEIDCTEHGCSFEFLSCLRHVKYLKMKSDFEETLFDMVGNGSMPKFVNLTKLKFAMTVEWYDLVKFLEVTDNLEVLVFHSSWTYKEPKRVPTCMLSCLRTVQINWFSYSNEGCFEIVRYILKNAQVLEMIKINSFYDLSADKQLDVLGRILSFERGSKSCQVVFDSD